MFCPYRVHNREADVIGPHDIYVEMVLWMLFEGFTSILLFVGFFPSRSYYRLVFVWEIDVGMEIEVFGIGAGVLSCHFKMTEFYIAVYTF